LNVQFDEGPTRCVCMAMIDHAALNAFIAEALEKTRRHE